jgi:hypothetical protein
MSNNFSPDFYVVVATINPIFFLALTLQGTFYNSLIKILMTLQKKQLKFPKRREKCLGN